MSAPSSTSRRERWIIGAALAGIAAVAWAYMIHEARAMDVSGVCECLGMQMGGARALVGRLAPCSRSFSCGLE